MKYTFIMTTITLDVPDQLAKQINANSQRMPHALSLALNLLGESSATYSLPAPTSPLVSEVIDFLASGPTPTDILRFKVSDEAQDRLETLLSINRESNLSPNERTELETYQQIHHLFVLLKARARTTLSSAI